MSRAGVAGTISSSARVKSFSVMPYFSFSSIMVASLTRSLTSSSSTASEPIRMFSSSPRMPSDSSRLFCSALRWGSRSVMQKAGSFTSSPTWTVTEVPSARVSTPCRDRGMVAHWYLRMPP